MTDAPAGTDRSPFLDESEILADLADASTEEAVRADEAAAGIRRES